LETTDTLFPIQKIAQASGKKLNLKKCSLKAFSASSLLQWKKTQENTFAKYAQISLLCFIPKFVGSKGIVIHPRINNIVEEISRTERTNSRNYEWNRKRETKTILPAHF